MRVQVSEGATHLQCPVIVIGATNLPQLIDPAILSSGRIDTCLYVPEPSERDRENFIRLSDGVPCM